MTRFKAREPEVVDAYQFIGGEKDGNDLVRMINQMGAANAKLDYDIDRNEYRISVVTDFFSEYIYAGDWLLIRDERNDLTHMSDKDFNAKYVKVKFRPSVLIWKDIPGFPDWQISDNGRVRNKGYAGYKHRSRKGDFILRRNGKNERWSEAQIGDEEQIKAFFSN